MDSRERTFTALEHREPDRIPVDFWASAGFRQRLAAETGLSFEQFLDANDVDLRYIEGPTYTGPSLAGKEPGTSRDIWGVPRKQVELELGEHREFYREVVHPPLAEAQSVQDVDDYPFWPSADDFDYTVVEGQCDRVRDKGRVVVFMGDRLNRVAQLKPAMYLRGVDAILLDMAMRPDMARAIFGHIRSFYTAYLERILDAAGGKIDIVLTGDDFGTQDGLLVSPRMWDDFLREGFREYIALVRAHGARAMHHTCGAVAGLIPAMMDCGLQILQSVQPEARGMDAARLKEAFGDRLCFHGGVSIQRTLPHGTPQAVQAEVKRVAETLGCGGGYIFCTAHNIQADTPMENVKALLRSYREYGRRET
jgi:uroporphyrinogen decarboxylase